MIFFSLWKFVLFPLNVFDIRCYAMTFDGYGYSGNYLVILNRAICEAWEREVGH